MVAEWRRLYGGGVDEGDRVERAEAEERMRELEIELIEAHGLTLPSRDDPVDRGRPALAGPLAEDDPGAGARRARPGPVAAPDTRGWLTASASGGDADGEAGRTRATDPA